MGRLLRLAILIGLFKKDLGHYKENLPLKVYRFEIWVYMCVSACARAHTTRPPPHSHTQRIQMRSQKAFLMKTLSVPNVRSSSFPILMLKRINKNAEDSELMQVGTLSEKGSLTPQEMSL